MKIVPNRILAALLLFLSLGMQAQQRVEGVVEWDKTVHDFGDILASDGPVSCTFTLTNRSSKPVAIYNVISSCGCTDVTWTREPIPAGGKGTVKATYSNDEGAYPFDKNLTVYVSSLSKPVILKLRGSTHAKKQPLGELYTWRFGDLGLKTLDVKVGNLSQGQQKSGEMLVANLGGAPLKLEFSGVSAGLSLSVSPNPIPAGATATLAYTVDADRSRWGKNYYYATPVVNGKALRAGGGAPAEKSAPGAEAMLSDPNPRLGAGKGEIGFWAFTREDFNAWSAQQKAAGANPLFESSTFNFGKVKAGTRVRATFALTNKGKSDLTVYKIDSDSNRAAVPTVPPLAPGAKTTLEFTLDTAGLPAGEVLVLLTLTTNSPLRPLVNLYITGFVN